jgi:hypothetical protein
MGVLSGFVFCKFKEIFRDGSGEFNNMVSTLTQFGGSRPLDNVALASV